MSSQSHRAAPDREQLPAVQKMRVRFAKRGRLRFASHRDFQRAFERALRRAGVPVAFSHGFTPHPKISFLGAAPTGAASEAEYLEISLTEHREPGQVQAALNEALPDGLDIVLVSEVDPAERVSLAERLLASSWEVALAGADFDEVRAAVDAFENAESVEVQRLTKKGMRTLDIRTAVLDISVAGEPDGGTPTLRCVVEHRAPTVRPEEVLAGLRAVSGFTPPTPPLATRLAQGSWEAETRTLLEPSL